jgi:hypothetical protein
LKKSARFFFGMMNVACPRRQAAKAHMVNNPAEKQK